ncbi:MAG: DNA cytosine methyltransferase [Pseudomonadota bacterium]
MFDALDLQSEPLKFEPTRPLIIDSFAGGGGASTGIEMALGRSPDIAINHDEIALSMHQANHPSTLHVINSVYAVDPRDFVKRGQRVGLAWYSPDCKDHSKAKGGKPLNKNIRDLAWVVVHHAKLIKPEIIMLENVEEFEQWCPLGPDGKRIPGREGETFRKWVRALRRLGYKVEWRVLRASGYRAPTIRKRLFVIARRDGKPIVWPEPTHGNPNDPDFTDSGLIKWNTAADIIDWSIPCPSIFDTREEIKKKYGMKAIRPLADNTLKRIARGVQRYVLEAENPFFVTYGQHGGRNRSGFDPVHTITASRKDQNAIVVPNLVSVNHGDSGGRREYPVDAPMNTITASNGHAIIAPTLVQTGYGERAGQKPRALDIHKPLGTVVAGGGKHALVSAFLAQHNSGPRMKSNAGRSVAEPLSTITTRGTQQQIVAAHMVNMHGTSRSARDMREPVTTITAGGNHAGLVAAFMAKYYGPNIGQACDEPLHTLTTKDRFSVITVEIQGEPYVITDIGMRMLTPREQFRAQGFPDSYIIDRGHDGRIIPKTQQTEKCGNSVPPDVVAALVSANAPHLVVREAAA